MVEDRLGIMIWMADVTLLQCKALFVTILATLVWSLIRVAKLADSTLKLTHKQWTLTSLFLSPFSISMWRSSSCSCPCLHSL